MSTIDWKSIIDLGEQIIFNKKEASPNIIRQRLASATDTRGVTTTIHPYPPPSPSITTIIGTHREHFKITLEQTCSSIESLFSNLLYEKSYQCTESIQVEKVSSETIRIKYQYTNYENFKLVKTILEKLIMCSSLLSVQNDIYSPVVEFVNLLNRTVKLHKDDTLQVTKPKHQKKYIESEYELLTTMPDLPKLVPQFEVFIHSAYFNNEYLVINNYTRSNNNNNNNNNDNYYKSIVLPNKSVIGFRM